ncbi:hypothetical protein IWZ03DRAFT_438998 [Phyllosticta citriasiana]|uniref:Uncharacterized protein n=1 Tax=Phyllosticta citriasiana TaxID=595635 RepID=A0ABR1KPD7_9PEZI
MTQPVGGALPATTQNPSPAAIFMTKHLNLPSIQQAAELKLPIIVNYLAKHPTDSVMEGDGHAQSAHGGKAKGAALSGIPVERPNFNPHATNAPAFREPEIPSTNDTVTDGPHQPFFQLIQYPEMNKTVGKFNQHTINITEGDSFGTVPRPVINTADPLWGCVVSNAVFKAFHQGRPIKDIIKSGARAADMVNEMIRDGESPPEEGDFPEA